MFKWVCSEQCWGGGGGARDVRLMYATNVCFERLFTDIHNFIKHLD